jgi:FdhE protein
VSVASAAAPSRLVTIERERPEWRGWLALVREVSRELGLAAWDACVPSVSPAHQEATPLLAGVELTIDAHLVASWVTRLLAVATSGRASASTNARDGDSEGDTRSPRAPAPRPPRPADAIAMMQASIADDLEVVDAIASRDGLDRGAARAVLPLVAMPLLHACRRAWRDRVSPRWNRGDCPVCGAWPTLAEARGLERARRLRCGRCGSDWSFDWLRCPYCDTQEHESLDSLVPESSLDTRKVEACRTCRGYLKSMATLAPLGPEDVLVEDLATVPLDVAALKRGYHRPAGSRHSLEVRIMEATSRRRRTLLAWFQRA